MADAEVIQGFLEDGRRRVVASVVGHHSFDGDSFGGEVAGSVAKELGTSRPLLVGQSPDKGDPTVIVDRYMEVVIASLFWVLSTRLADTLGRGSAIRLPGGSGPAF